MARNNTRRNRTDFAHLRAGANDWRTLASAAVTSALVIALAVAVLALIEAVFSRPASDLAQRAPARPDSHGWRTGGLEPLLFSNLCPRREPLSCLAD